MAEVRLLEELLIALAVTVSIVYLFQKVRVPVIVGFFLAGVVRAGRFGTH
jgi:Kef-type K+ transport system membrane component KefB